VALLGIMRPSLPLALSASHKHHNMAKHEETEILEELGIKKAPRPMLDVGCRLLPWKLFWHFPSSQMACHVCAGAQEPSVHFHSGRRGHAEDDGRERTASPCLPSTLQRAAHHEDRQGAQR
jgi:hypothetical protein